MDALLQKLGSEEETYLTRLTVSRQGEYLFLVAGSATKGEYPKWKRTFGAAAVSFAPTGK